MAGGFTIRFEGMDKVINSVKALGPNIQKEVTGEFVHAADETRNIAVRLAPADEGAMHNAIQTVREANGSAVVVGKFYGPYMEFGTKGNFKPTAGSGNYAAQFRNIKSKGGDPIKALTGWVHRKGLAKSGKSQSVSERQIAFLIYRSIKKYGVKAHPFLFPAFFEVGKRLVQRIQNIVSQEVRK